MKILFVHQGFPGQFKHLIPYLQSRGDIITAIGASTKQLKIHKSVRYCSYNLERGNGRDTHNLAIETESKILRGEACAKLAEKMKASGYTPDLIYAHPGWGESLFLGDIWEKTPQLHYVEFAYRAKGADSDFNDRFSLEQTLQERSRGRMKNANVLLNLESMDWGISPTYFQKSTLPVWGQLKTSVIHEGIDTNWASPDPKAELELMNGTKFRQTDEIITFVNRTFEPYRGIHILLEALPKVLATRPSARVILVGNDSPIVSYGANRTDGQGWLSALRNEIGQRIDWNRVHHVGTVPHNILRQIFRISSAHVYLTYPFVLSWSLLEAMSCESLVICSDTAPVQEVVKHEINGLLIPFDDVDALSKALIDALVNKRKYKEIRKNARKTILMDYDLKKCLLKQAALVDAVAMGFIAA